MSMTVCASSTSRVTAPTRPRGFLAVLAAAVDTLFAWQARFEQREQLKGMEGHIRHDLGLSASDIDKEISKPFWQV